MHCKTCDYQLWNIPSRQCPECGTPFRVSDYEFVPNSVRFCCPHCGQDYYGTGEKGHLVPQAFVCVKCGRPVHMNDMVLLPAEGLDDEQTEVYRAPWLQREKVGWLRAWWSTVKMSLRRPTQMMRGVPPSAGPGQAWRFAAINQLVCWAGMVLAFLLFMGAVGFFSGGKNGPALLGVGACFLVVLPLVMLAGMAIWAGSAHLVLRLTGGSKHGFGRTCEAVCYSSGTNVLLFVPICGTYFHWIWWMVSGIFALREAQRVHGLRATLAMGMLPLLMFGLSVGPRIYWGTPASRGVTLVGTYEVMAVAGPLRSRALVNGQPPRHVAQLIAEGVVPRGTFELRDSSTSADSLTVAGVSLAALETMPIGQKTAVANAAADALPANVIAYRLGDLVFTYPGIDFATADPQLWTVIAWPDPDSNPSPDSVAFGQVDGSAMSCPADYFAARLLPEQNSLRAKAGLAPLPSPDTVTNAQPAVVQAEQSLHPDRE